MKFLNSEKAVTEVVGHMIIMSLTVTGIALIALVGVPSIYKMQDMANVRNVEQTYSMLDSRASKVILGEAQAQIIDASLGGGSLSVVSNSSIVASSSVSYVSVEFAGINPPPPIKIPMGTIIYKMGDREVAYEAGGVWSRYPAGSVMLSPPEFNYNGVTLNLPIVNITGNSSMGGKGTASLTIEKTSDVQVIYPNATYGNPLPDNVTLVTITIKSDYYDAWADYFRSSSLAKVSEDPVNKTATITLEPPPVVTNFSYGALASRWIIMNNNANTDSYNSSKGIYTSSKTGNGSIRATESIEIDNNAEVNGSVLTMGDITGGGKITKDAYARSFGGVTVKGTKYQAVEGLTLGSTTALVQSKMNNFASSNDNLMASSGGCLKGVGNRTLDSSWITATCTISRGSTGNYYLTTFSMSNNKVLIFNTSGGNINIAVDSADFSLSNGANITVLGSNPVRLYLNRRILLSNNVEINRASNDKSSLFQIISSSSQNIDLSNNAIFCGFIWDPNADITLSNVNGVYGAVVGKTFTIGNNQFMHFDEALRDINTVIETGTTIRYLYITRSDAKVSFS